MPDGQLDNIAQRAQEGLEQGSEQGQSSQQQEDAQVDMAATAANMAAPGVGTAVKAMHGAKKVGGAVVGGVTQGTKWSAKFVLGTVIGGALGFGARKTWDSTKAERTPIQLFVLCALISHIGRWYFTGGTFSSNAITIMIDIAFFIWFLYLFVDEPGLTETMIFGSAITLGVVSYISQVILPQFVNIPILNKIGDSALLLGIGIFWGTIMLKHRNIELRNAFLALGGSLGAPIINNNFQVITSSNQATAIISIFILYFPYWAFFGALHRNKDGLNSLSLFNALVFGCITFFPFIALGAVDFAIFQGLSQDVDFSGEQLDALAQMRANVKNTLSRNWAIVKCTMDPSKLAQSVQPAQKTGLEDPNEDDQCKEILGTGETPKTPPLSFTVTKAVDQDSLSTRLEQFTYNFNVDVNNLLVDEMVAHLSCGMTADGKEFLEGEFDASLYRAQPSTLTVTKNNPGTSSVQCEYLAVPQPNHYAVLRAEMREIKSQSEFSRLFIEDKSVMSQQGKALSAQHFPTTDSRRTQTDNRFAHVTLSLSENPDDSIIQLPRFSKEEKTVRLIARLVNNGQGTIKANTVIINLDPHFSLAGDNPCGASETHIISKDDGVIVVSTEKLPIESIKQGTRTTSVGLVTCNIAYTPEQVGDGQGVAQIIPKLYTFKASMEYDYVIDTAQRLFVEQPDGAQTTPVASTPSQSTTKAKLVSVTSNIDGTFRAVWDDGGVMRSTSAGEITITENGETTVLTNQEANEIFNQEDEGITGSVSSTGQISIFVDGKVLRSVENGFWEVELATGETIVMNNAEAQTQIFELDRESTSDTLIAQNTESTPTGISETTSQPESSSSITEAS